MDPRLADEPPRFDDGQICGEARVRLRRGADVGP